MFNRNKYKKLKVYNYLNDVEMIKLIVENEGNINVTKKGLNSLFLALENNLPLEVFEVLLDLGVDVNHTNKTGDSIAHICNDLEIMKLLIKHKADFNIRNKRSYTPIFECNDYKKVELLLEGGANINVVDSKGKHFLRTINSSNFDLMRVYIDNGMNRFLEKGGFMLDKFIEKRSTSEVLVYYEHKLITQPNKFSIK